MPSHRMTAFGLMASAYAFCVAVPAYAQIPTLNATCPTGIEVHTDEGGPVYVNGNKASIEKFNESVYEATHSNITVEIMTSADGSVSVSYTGPGGANGICQVHGSSPVEETCPVDVSEADRANYPACN